MLNKVGKNRLKIPGHLFLLQFLIRHVLTTVEFSSLPNRSQSPGKDQHLKQHINHRTHINTTCNRQSWRTSTGRSDSSHNSQTVTISITTESSSSIPMTAPLVFEHLLEAKCIMRVHSHHSAMLLTKPSIDSQFGNWTKAPETLLYIISTSTRSIQLHMVNQVRWCGCRGWI
jgi:hypothetical protein